MNAEIQGQFSSVPGHLIIGADWAKTNGKTVLSNETPDPIVQSILGDPFVTDNTDYYRTGYGYWTFSPLKSLEWTMGAAFAELDASTFSKKQSGWYPKLSVVYQINPLLDLRAAYFKSLKRPLDIEQTLEPTQLGGFNQFYDEGVGIESNQYALGFDVNTGVGHWLGGEVTFQKAEIPSGNQNTTLQKADLTKTKLFWNWSTKPWAVSLAYYFEKSKYVNLENAIANIPTPLTTHRVPFRVQWLSASGLMASATTTYFKQNAEFDQGFNRADTHFVLLDAAISYPLWRNKIEVDLRCDNVFNKSFNYQNTSLLDPTPRLSMHLPERTFLFGIKLAY
jgi:hypothetical protein